MDDDLIKAKCKCCNCGKSLTDSKHVNCILLDHVATWKYPTWGNIIYDVPVIGAIAVLCDECLKKKANPQQAIEWSDNELAKVTYHPVSELQKFVAITERLAAKLFFEYAGQLLG